MRDLVSDDVPSEIIHSNSVNPNFKVRKAWWAGITEFMEEFRQQGFFDQDRLTTAEDIQRALE